MQNLNTDHEPPPVYRIGAVARLAGVPVPTLRVWESRHAAFQPLKSAGSHRLYAEGDVTRARLLRQLTQSGHSIGGIARLPSGELQQLLGRTRGAAASKPVQPPRRMTTVVVGEATAARIEAAGRALADALDVRQVFAALEQAADGTPAEPVDLLLVRLNTVQPGTLALLARVVARHGVRRAIVLYNYGAQAAVEALRSAGLTVRREPLSGPELAELIGSLRMVDASGAMPMEHAGPLIPERRYSDAALARVAAAPSSVVCECPRHIADLIGQLAAFEEYSQECLNDSSEDAALHAYLRSLAGSARALFEHALERAAAHGGLTLE
jgi:DNA-binding transcriptional MerR regulator